MSDEQAELLRQLIDNLDQFREATVETFRVLHRTQKRHTDALRELRTLVNVLIAVVGLTVFLLLIATIAAMVQGR